MIAWWELPEEEQDAAWAADVRARSRSIARLRASIGAAVAGDGAFETPNGFPRGGRSIVHRSTQGARWQLTWIDDDGPVGHTEPPSLSAAAERVWEDLTQDQRQHWI